MSGGLVIPCPCCRTLVHAEAHPGILINQRASLSAAIVIYERQIKEVDPTLQPQRHASILARLEAAKTMFQGLTPSSP